MELDNLLKELQTKYLFGSADYTVSQQAPGLDVCFRLNEDQIATVISKAGRLNSIVESCANMITIFDPSAPKEELLKTSIRCVGANELHICTTQSMLKLLVETLFD